MDDAFSEVKKCRNEKYKNGKYINMIIRNKIKVFAVLVTIKWNSFYLSNVIH